MATLNVTNIPGSLPSGYCWPAAPQTFYNDIIQLLTSYVTGQFSSFVFGADTPDPEYNDLPWIKVDAQNNLVGLYTYGQYGLWARAHPVPYSSDIRMLWVGLEADLKTFDGGEDTPVTATTGPFWEVDHNFDFRFPLGPGTSPDATVVAVGDTGGVEDVTLTEAQMPLHGHSTIVNTGGEDQSDATGGLMVGPGSSVKAPFEGDPPTETAGEQVAGAGGDESHTNMPPYRGCFIIKRTAREYIRG